MVNKYILKSKNIPLLELEISVTEKTINAYLYKSYKLTKFLRESPSLQGWDESMILTCISLMS